MTTEKVKKSQKRGKRGKGTKNSIAITNAKIAQELGYSPQWFGKRKKAGFNLEEKEQLEIAFAKLFNELMVEYGLRIRFKSNKQKVKEVANENDIHNG